MTSCISKKTYIKTYIDEKFDLYILDKEGKEYLGLGNTEIYVCGSLSIIFAMIKIYEKYKNTKIFIFIEDPTVMLDEECSLKFTKTLVSAFSQIIFASKETFNKTQYGNKSLIPHNSYYKISDTDIQHLLNCISENYYLFDK